MNRARVYPKQTCPSKLGEHRPQVHQHGLPRASDAPWGGIPQDLAPPGCSRVGDSEGRTRFCRGRSRMSLAPNNAWLERKHAGGVVKKEQASISGKETRLGIFFSEKFAA